MSISEVPDWAIPFEDLRLSITASLPEKISTFVQFNVDEKHEYLIVRWAPLGDDFPKFADVLAHYKGEYVSAGKDDNYYRVKPSATPKPEVPAENKPEAKKAKPEPKAAPMPSPIKIFYLENCEKCDEHGSVCTSKDKQRRLECIEIQRLNIEKKHLDEEKDQTDAIVDVLKTLIANQELLQQRLAQPLQVSQPSQVPQSTQSAQSNQSTQAPKNQIDKVRMAFPENLEQLLSFEQKPDYVQVKPKQFMGSENFAKIASIIRGLGGEYISAGKDSHFRVYNLAQGAANPSPSPNSSPSPAAAPQGHTDKGVVWMWVEKDGGDRYEKALSSDNSKSQEFANLLTKIQQSSKGGFFNEDDKLWYWEFNQGPAAIGRKTPKKSNSRRY